MSMAAQRLRLTFDGGDVDGVVGATELNRARVADLLAAPATK